MTTSAVAMSADTLGLALSGGGSRAIAFHLGCLRGLHKLGLLDRVTTMSSVSGGSVIAALYCSHEGNFETFENDVRKRLRQGFLWPAAYEAVFSFEGLKALITFVLISLDRLVALPAKLAFLLLPLVSRRDRWPYRPVMHRRASRTSILRRVFDKVFGSKNLSALRDDRPRLIIVACELRAKAAFYFTKEKLHCWRYGSASSENISLAHAVAASAAYPLALPAMDATIEFERGGAKRAEWVTLTDGGVYDNLGLMPFWPDRDHSISLEVDPVDKLVACRAGYSLDVGEPSSLIFARMAAVFESIFARAQNASTTRLFDLQDAGKIGGFVMPYLGQNDARLTKKPEDFMSGDDVAGYGTNFSAMSDEWIDRLSLRGEQLVASLVSEHWPDILNN